MTEQTSTYCDVCNYEQLEFDHGFCNAPFEEAKLEGWIEKDGKQICPDCQIISLKSEEEEGEQS